MRCDLDSRFTLQQLSVEASDLQFSPNVKQWPKVIEFEFYGRIYSLEKRREFLSIRGEVTAMIYANASCELRIYND